MTMRISFTEFTVAQVELLPQLLRMMDVKTMTGSEGQRKLTLGNATILAYCLRWAGFRVSAEACPLPECLKQCACARSRLNKQSLQ